MKSAIKKKKILHMDNEADVLISVKTILEKEGYEVNGTLTGEATLDAIDKEDFDLLLLDIMMPDLSGWDVFSRVMKRKSDQKVAFLTVLEISPERKKALQKLGIAEYFIKPINIKDFTRRMKDVLKD